jgi:hypothetical protein
MARSFSKPPTSPVFDSIEAELSYAGDRQQIQAICAQIGDELRSLDLPSDYWSYIEIGRGAKKNFAQRLSNSLAQKMADALRPGFRGILPDEHGRGQESRSRGAGGPKKLDVNYSHVQIGLGLGVSIKTINFKDEKTGRYTKNIKRLDGELRAEAQDYHVRQPYSVLAALIFMPDEAALDSDTKSSLRHAWEVFQRRSGRKSTTNDASLFERIWLCVYDTSEATLGTCRCFDVGADFPYAGLPTSWQTLSELIPQIDGVFRDRNKR